MTKAFKAGDKVLVARGDDETDWTTGLTGKVVATKKKTVWGDLNVLVEFSEKDADGRGHNDDGEGGDEHPGKLNRWWVEDVNLDPVVEDVLTLGTPEFTTKHFRAGSQSSRILAHLLAGKTISQGKCNIVYGPWRLSDIIFNIRKAGFEVVTTMKTDESGHEYASYSLAAKAA